MNASEQFRLEQAIQTLDAIVSAMEGEVQIGSNGIVKAYNNDEYELFLLCDDGRTLRPEEVCLQDLEAAIQHWRDGHMQFFQKILGAMM